jgi:hypothetical protein
MKVERERFLLLATALAACHESQPALHTADAAYCAVDASAAVPASQGIPPEAPASSSVATSSAASSSLLLDGSVLVHVPLTMARSTPGMAPARSLPICGEIAEHNDRLLASPSGWCEGFASEVEGVRARVAMERTANPAWHYCHQGKGTWAVRLLSVALDAPSGEAGGCGWGATYELVYQGKPDAPGERAVSEPMTFNAYPDSTSKVSPEMTFDYDGDGHDELIVGFGDWENGGGGNETVTVVRAAGSAVGAYDVGFRYDGVADVDGDGRPDLLQGDFFTTTRNGLMPHYVAGPPLLIHSLPNGKFSMSDDAARRWAVTECPKATPAPADCATRAGCMVLWGRPKVEIAKWLDESEECAENKRFGGGDIAKGELPFRPLNIDTPKALPPTKMIIEPQREGIP